MIDMETTERLPAVSESQSENLMPIAPAALEIQERTQLDSMLRQAQLRPRAEIAKLREKALSMATVDMETAESCMFTLKRWDAELNGYKFYHGPSIRFAEIIVSCWGNIRAGARVIDNDGRKITA